jgi:hypothetical protein
MTLEKILGFEYSYADGEIEHATRGILKEIHNYWGITAAETDLEIVSTERYHRKDSDEKFVSFFFHFNATQSLIDKFENNPEALI